MTTFEEREKGYEAKFKRDQEFQFKATARRNKLLGLWAAERLGLSGGDADAYAKEVVVADFEEPGDDDVLRKVAEDLDGKGVTAAEVRREMDRLMPIRRRAGGKRELTPPRRRGRRSCRHGRGGISTEQRGPRSITMS